MVYLYNLFDLLVCVDILIYVYICIYIYIHVQYILFDIFLYMIQYWFILTTCTCWYNHTFNLSWARNHQFGGFVEATYFSGVQGPKSIFLTSRGSKNATVCSEWSGWGKAPFLGPQVASSVYLEKSAVNKRPVLNVHPAICKRCCFLFP